MGFRDPITTATDVDTRTTVGIPGMYTTETSDYSGNTTMTVALTDGFSTDGDAGLVRTAAPNQRAAAQSNSGGLAVKGGKYRVANPGGTGGLDAPTLTLNVEQDPADPTAAIATLRVTGADVIDLGPVAQLHANAQQSFTGNGWKTFTLGAADVDTAGGWSATVSGAKGPDHYVVQQKGSYAIEGIAAINSVPAGAYTGARITINGTAPSGSPGMIAPTGAIAGSMSALTGRKRYSLAVGDVIALQGYCDQATWNTRMTAVNDGITSQLLIERVG